MHSESLVTAHGGDDPQQVTYCFLTLLPLLILDLPPSIFLELKDFLWDQQYHLHLWLLHSPACEFDQVLLTKRPLFGEQQRNLYLTGCAHRDALVEGRTCLGNVQSAIECSWNNPTQKNNCRISLMALMYMGKFPSRIALTSLRQHCCKSRTPAKYINCGHFLAFSSFHSWIDFTCSLICYRTIVTVTWSLSFATCHVSSDFKLTLLMLLVHMSTRYFKFFVSLIRITWWNRRWFKNKFFSRPPFQTNQFWQPGSL